MYQAEQDIRKDMEKQSKNNSMINPSTRRVSIIGLKELVRAKWPAGSLLRQVLQDEPDEMTPREYLAKLEVWLRLLQHEQ